MNKIFEQYIAPELPENQTFVITKAIIQAMCDEDFVHWDQQMGADHYEALLRAAFKVMGCLPAAPKPTEEWMREAVKSAADIFCNYTREEDCTPQRLERLMIGALSERMPFETPTAPAEGWQWVPVEPTEEMLNEGTAADTHQSRMEAKCVWDAMIAAAPKT